MTVVDEIEIPTFWKIYITVTLLISGISFVSLNTKKSLERLKDKRIKNKVNVMIPPPNTGQYCIEMKSKQFLKLNNSRHNEPMFTGIQMIAVVSFSFGFVLLIIFSSLFIDPRKIFLYQTMILEPLLMKVIIPIIYLLFRKDVRSFIYRNIKENILSMSDSNTINKPPPKKTSIPNCQILMNPIGYAHGAPMDFQQTCNGPK